MAGSEYMLQSLASWDVIKCERALNEVAAGKKSQHCSKELAASKLELLEQLRRRDFISLLHAGDLLRIKPTKGIVRSLLNAHSGLPVYINVAPRGMPNQHKAGCSFVALQSPGTLVQLAAQHHAAKEQLRLLGPDVVSKVQAAYIAAGRAQDGHRAAFATLISALVGDTRAKQLTDRSKADLLEMQGSTEQLAAQRDAVLAQAYEAQCMMAGVCLRDPATMAPAFKQRVYRLAASALKVVSVTRQVLDTPQRQMFAAFRGEAVEWVKENRTPAQAKHPALRKPGRNLLAKGFRFCPEH
jgi:hypothetical protein